MRTYWSIQAVYRGLSLTRLCGITCTLTHIELLCRYLESLLGYLENYSNRVKPLLDLNDEMGKVLMSFDDQWSEGAFPGWPVCSSFHHHSRAVMLNIISCNITRELSTFNVSVLFLLAERDSRCAHSLRRTFRPLRFLVSWCKCSMLGWSIL